MRNHKSMQNNFISRPFDVYTVINESNVISDSIKILVSNESTRESFYMALKNRPETKNLLFELANMHNRTVKQITK